MNSATQDMDLASEITEIKRLVTGGLDEKRAWTTRLFYSSWSPARSFFAHSAYGLTKGAKTIDPDFFKHVTSEATRWFSGKSPVQSDSPKHIAKMRALLRERETRSQWCDYSRDPRVLFKDALNHKSMILAHDIALGDKTEGGPKLYCNASPWQVLYAISVTVQNESVPRALLALSAVTSHRVNPTWYEEGQPLVAWPACSLYNIRCNELAEIGSREYFFTIDLDGVKALDIRIGELDADFKKRCRAVISQFEKGGDDALAPPLLQLLSEAIREAFASVSSREVFCIVAQNYRLETKLAWICNQWHI